MRSVSSALRPTSTCTLILRRIGNGHGLPVVVNSLRTRTVGIMVVNCGVPEPLARSLFLAIAGRLKATLGGMLVCGMGSKICCSCLFLRGRNRMFGVSSHASSTVTLTVHYKYPICAASRVVRDRRLRRIKDATFSIGMGAISIIVLGRTLSGTVRRRGCRRTSHLHSRVGQQRRRRRGAVT